MGLWDSTKALFRGEGGNALDYLFIDSETVEASNRADRGLDKLNREKYEAGGISETEFRARQARITNWAFPDFQSESGTGRIFDQPGVSPWEGFKEGAVDGANNIRKNLASLITGLVGTTARLIPWQLWVVAVGYLLFLTSPFWLPVIIGKKK